jgi:hypothetical protein
MENKLKEIAAEAKQRGFKPVDVDKIRQNRPPTRDTEVLVDKLPPDTNGRNLTPLAVLDMFFREASDLWLLIAQSINDQIREKLSLGLRSPYGPTVTSAEARLVFFLRMRLTLIQGTTLRETYSDLKLAWYMHFDRFVFLSSQVDVSPDQLSESIRCVQIFSHSFISVIYPLRYNARTFFIPGSWLALDELVFPWYGRDPLKIYIPRKPHPNGFLVYLVCCKLNNGKPLVLDIVFDWSASPLVERRTPTEVLRTTVSRLRANFQYQDHRIILHNDAAFGGATGADLCAASGVEAICSTSTPGVHRLLTLLSPRLQPNCFFFFRSRAVGTNSFISFVWSKTEIPMHNPLMALMTWSRRRSSGYLSILQPRYFRGR